MKRIPMMLQLVIILFCVMVIPTAILTSYSGSHFLDYSEDTIAETSLAGLNASRNLFENALSNLEGDAVLLSSSNLFNQIRLLDTYDQVNANYTNINIALAILRELANLNRRVDGAYSSYFYLEGSNYVISTDKGITTSDRYDPIDWMEEAIIKQRGISGVWYPRQLSNGLHALTYVLPLSNLTTTTRGTIVVNLLETQISEYLHSSDPGEQTYYLLNAEGQIVSHSDRGKFLASGSEWPFLQEILANPRKQGYMFQELEGDRMLVTWSQSSRGEWFAVKLFSMDELMTKSNAIQRNIVLTMIIIIVVSAAITVFLARWLSTPLRKLVQAVSTHPKLKVLQKRNELAFLDDAFKRMQEEEEALHQMLQEREQDTRSLAVQRLLRGEVTEQIAEIFPELHYRIAVLSIDRYRLYVSKNNRETRSYNRYLFVQKCESLFPEGVHGQIVYQGEGYFSLVMNGGRLDKTSILTDIEESLKKIRDEAKKLFGQSVTISVSDYTESASQLPELLAEAMELIKYRMIRGGGSITFWQEESESSRKYIYPANSERRILNYLDMNDLDSIMNELKVIREEIRSVDYISYDNILFIYNQLAGVTIRHLRENANTAGIFAGRSNIYSRLATFDTLEEIEEYLHDFYRDIMRSLESSSSKTNHAERIIQYLEEHYSRDIVFEDMAKEIGISYSYMRKIVSEQTGKSLIDYLNQLRIEKAKELLSDAELNIAQIAEMVGYHNVQSFNRFFRKYEGMSPSNYRALKLSPST